MNQNEGPLIRAQNQAREGYGSALVYKREESMGQHQRVPGQKPGAEKAASAAAITGAARRRFGSGRIRRANPGARVAHGAC